MFQLVAIAIQLSALPGVPSLNVATGPQTWSSFFEEYADFWVAGSATAFQPLKGGLEGGAVAGRTEACASASSASLPHPFDLAESPGAGRV